MEIVCSKLTVTTPDNKPSIVFDATLGSPHVFMAGESDESWLVMNVDRGRPRVTLKTPGMETSIISEQQRVTLIVGEDGKWPVIRLVADLSAQTIELETSSNMKILKNSAI